MLRLGPLLVLALAKDDCSGVKTGGMTGASFTGISTTVNVSVGAAGAGAAEGAAQGMDKSAGEKGATEYPGNPQRCRFVVKDGVRKDVVCE